MGATFYSFAVRTLDPTVVREQIVNWMTAKGFELSTTRRMSRLDPDRERGFYLFSNSEWTIVLYSDDFEFDRLSFELRKLKLPFLYLGCQDSDYWGYQLYDGKQLVDEFQTATFWLSWPPDVRESAWKLCLALGIEDRFYEVCRLIRHRAIFSEYVLSKFCSSLGFFPASFAFRQIDASVLGFSEVQNVDGYRSEHLCFRQRNRIVVALHDIATCNPSAQNRGMDMPLPEEFLQAALEMAERARRSLWFYRIFIHAIHALYTLVLFPTFWMIAIISRLSHWVVSKRLLVRSKTEEEKPDYGRGPFGNFMQAITSLEPNYQRMVNHRIFNDRFYCSLELPHKGRILPKRFSSDVFRFQVNEAEVHCSSMNEAEIKQEIGDRPSKVIRDEKFRTSSGLEARLISIEVNRPDGSTYSFPFFYIQNENVFFKIWIPGSNEPKEDLLKSIAMSFECHPQAHDSSATLLPDEPPLSPETQA